eukprot:COSAG06_NODE_44521_length_362_cov_2.673004_1_plen_37_part_10
MRERVSTMNGLLVIPTTMLPGVTATLYECSVRDNGAR